MAQRAPSRAIHAAMTSFIALTALTLGVGATKSNGAGRNGFAQDDAMSNLGTPFAPYLPKFLTNNPLPNGKPWSDKTVQNTNALDKSQRPDTGVTRTYEWSITKETAAPDGVDVPMLLVNGQFPGPIVECNWGDWLESAAIHWHGTLQQETPFMDGVPGVTQCPIAPGSSFTYKFKPDLYGSSWYHSHYEEQYASGIVGPMVVYGPTHVDYDIDIGPVVVSDYYHEYYTTIVQGYFEQRVDVTKSDNNLINGKNSYNGNDAPLASFNFTSGKTMLMRLINTSGFAVEKVSIDNHNFTIIANDFVPLQPYDTDVVTLAPGQRADVIVKANGKPTDAVWLRAFKPGNCSPSQQNSNWAKAAVFYENADRTKQPSSQQGSNADNDYCGNDDLSLTVPYYSLTPSEPSFTEVIGIELKNNGTSNLWYMQDRTFRADYNSPMLAQAQTGNLDFEYIQNVHNYGSNSSLRFIIQNPGREPHPMHLHGHNFWVLAEGSCGSSNAFGDEQGSGNDQSSDVAGHSGLSSGKDNSNRGHGRRSDINKRQNGDCWDGKITNANNPQRRDVQMVLPNSYMVMQWNQDNAGIWPLHCHIAWHVSAGFTWIVLEDPDGIMNQTDIASVNKETCNNWYSWTAKNVVGQIDDGI